MNKKINTVLFMIAATIGATLLTLAFLLIPLLILGLILKEKFAEISWIILPLFIAAMVGSFVVYSLIMKKINARVDMNKYFEPILSKKKPNNNNPIM